MIWIIGFALVGLFIGQRQRFNSFCNRLPVWERMIISFASSVIGGTTGCIIAGFVGEASSTHLEPAGYVKLVSLRDGDGAAGGFFLGSGYVGSEPYYFYYRQLDDGGYAPGHVPADRHVVIREEARADGVLEFYTLERDSKSNLFSLCMHCGVNAQYKFIVPKGTVQRAFSLR